MKHLVCLEPGECLREPCCGPSNLDSVAGSKHTALLDSSPQGVSFPFMPRLLPPRWLSLIVPFCRWGQLRLKEELGSSTDRVPATKLRLPSIFAAAWEVAVTVVIAVNK